MWIIRFQKLKPCHYNAIAREFKKENFITRKLAPMLYIKAAVLFVCHSKSWRQIGQELGTSHVYLYNFYQKYHNSEMLSRIFSLLIDARIMLYIGEKKNFSVHELDNTDTYISLTKHKLEDIMQS